MGGVELQLIWGKDVVDFLDLIIWANPVIAPAVPDDAAQIAVLG